VKEALQSIARDLRNPFLRGLLGLTIVLALVAIARAGFEALLLLSAVVIILYIAYLLFLSYKTNAQNSEAFRQLALRIVIAIRKPGYVPGKVKQSDLGAALAEHVRNAASKYAKNGGKIMAEEFEKGLDVPESMRG
jgi:hypothetical protein